MSPIDGDFNSPLKSVYAQSPVFEDAVVPVPYEVVAGGMVFRVSGCPRASMHGLDCPVVPDDAVYGGTCHLRTDVVFVAEPAVNELVECFLAKRPMLPRCLADHVATVEIGGACIGECLGLVGSRFDTHCVGKRIKHVASPLPDISFNNSYYNNRLLKERGKRFPPPTRGRASLLKNREELEEITIGALSKAVYQGDTKHGSMMCGQIAGMINEIRPCKDIIETIVANAQKVLENTEIRL